MWLVPLTGTVPLGRLADAVPAYARDRPTATRGQRERLEANAALALLGGGATGPEGTDPGHGWRRAPGGRPCSPAGWSVSLSHADGLAAVAVAPPGRRVGVDVERRAALRDLDGLARTALTTAELRRWSAGPHDARLGEFLRLWVRKEAVLKALGVGLGGDLRSVGSGPAGELAALPSDAGAPVEWTLRELPVSGATAAVAIDDPGVAVRCRHVELTDLLGAARVR